MADTVTKEKRSWIMSRVKSKNTKPEKYVRSVLHGMGYRFRLHASVVPGHPDAVLKKYRTAVFVNGCFWHGHDGCKKATTPKTNSDFWKAKVERNKKRDKSNYESILRTGWNVLLIWECELSDKARLKEKIVSFFNKVRCSQL